MTISVVLSKDDCYKSLPDFYEMLADKVHECTGGSRPPIDRRNISVTLPVYTEIIRCLTLKYHMTAIEIINTFLSYGPKTILSERENTPYRATWNVTDVHWKE